MLSVGGLFGTNPLELNLELTNSKLLILYRIHQFHSQRHTLEKLTCMHNAKRLTVRQEENKQINKLGRKHIIQSTQK